MSDARVSDPGVDAYFAVLEAEPVEYVTDPAEVAALVAASPFAPRRRRWRR